MKETTIQIRRMRGLQPLGLLPVAALILAFQQDPANVSGQSDKMREKPAEEVREQHFNGNVESFAPTVSKVAPAVVRIVASVSPDSGRENPSWRYLLGQIPQGNSRRSIKCGLGSGVIVSKDGFILTNGHLVNGMTEVEVGLQDGRKFSARVIGIDVKSDIAVVKIDASDLPFVELAESRNVQVGDLVLAIGYPFGVGQTVTHGIVSATDRGGIGIEDYESFIQTDAPINPGNSGGALVDVNGHLIGINAAILSSSGGNMGIGFAIPSDLARRVMTDLVEYGYVVRGYLGVEAQDLTPELAEEFNVHGATGALVGGVTPDSPAEKAGLEVGDVITRFDGKAVIGARHLRLSVADAKPGQTVQFEVLRNGSARQLNAKLGQPTDELLLARAECPSDEQDPGALLGVTIGELNNQIRQQLRIPRYVHGAVVLDVNPLSNAAEAGLKAGDVIQTVNRHEVATGEDASRLMQDTKRTLLRVWSNGGSHFLLVDLSQSG